MLTAMHQANISRYILNRLEAEATGYFLYLVREILSSTRKDRVFFIPKLRKDS